MNYHDTDSPNVESYRITDRDGDLWAVITYFDPSSTPEFRYNTWVIDFANGERLTGEPADEVVRRLLDDGTDGGHTDDNFDAQADSMLDTLVYDDDSWSWRIDIRGVQVWFQDCADRGGDVALYDDRDQDSRVAVIEDPPFDAAFLEGAMNAERRRVDG